jgi:hypothetical protein
MFSHLLRRSHMYLALFLTPWMLMYALSTMAMNHRHFLRGGDAPGPPPFEKERETVLDGAIAGAASPREVGAQALAALGLEGRFSVRREADGARFVILRQDPVRPRRVTYTPAGGHVLIEGEVFRTPAFLERMHRRRGFEAGLWLENLWAASVDLVIVAMVFWALSGLWMWWGLRPTRVWGTAAMLGGAGLFAFFLATM